MKINEMDPTKNKWSSIYKELTNDSKNVLGIDISTIEFISLSILLKLKEFKSSNYSDKELLHEIIDYTELALLELDKSSNCGKVKLKSS